MAGRLAKLVGPRLLSQNQAGSTSQPKRKEAASKVRNMSTKFFYQGTPQQVGHGKANLIKQDKLAGGARCNRVATTGVATEVVKSV